MPFYRLKFLNHLKSLRPVLAATGAQAFIDPFTLVLRLRRGEETRVLYPQFLRSPEGKNQYTHAFEVDALRFIGWYPSARHRWPLASEKLLFKRFAVENSILTPEYSTDPVAAMPDVLVKRSVSSFSFAIRGPFRASSEYTLDAAAGEYFERFVRGLIAKIWYWNDRPVCLEMERMPYVQGNGITPIGLLATRRLHRRLKRGAAKRLEDFLRFQGVSSETVLEKGVVQTIDFRYGSRFSIPAYAHNVDLVREMIPSLESQLRDIGRKLWGAVSGQADPNTVFTVDAIIDAEDRIWTLEMNCNPAIHPYVYPTMIGSLFDTRQDNIELATAVQ